MGEILLTRGKVAIVDDEDYSYLNQWKWNYKSKGHGNTGYAVRDITENGIYKAVLMHREIIRPSDSMEVDHIDGNGLDNRKVNLREATRSQNQQAKGRQRNNTSGYKGVSYDAEKDKWRAQITYKGKGHKLGRYKIIEDAARAYNKAAIKYHGEFASLNTIQG